MRRTLSLRTWQDGRPPSFEEILHHWRGVEAVVWSLTETTQQFPNSTFGQFQLLRSLLKCSHTRVPVSFSYYSISGLSCALITVAVVSFKMHVSFIPSLHVAPSLVFHLLARSQALF